jgi:fused signal recognition particle receptor
MLKFFSTAEQGEPSTRDSKNQNPVFSRKLGKAVAGKSTVDEDVLDELEEILITSDVGVDTTIKIIESRIEAKSSTQDKYLGTQELDKILREEIAGLLRENNTLRK